MPKTCYLSIGQFITCEEFCAIVNKIRKLIGIGINSNFP